MRCRWSLQALLALAVFGLAIGGGRWSSAQVEKADEPGEFKVLPVGWGSIESASEGGEADCGAAASWDTCGCGPLWTIRAGAVILKRERPDAYPIFSDLSNGATLLDAEDYRFGHAGGLDFTAMRQLGDCHALEVRYFGIDGWTANQSGALAASSRLNAAGTVDFIGFGGYDSAYGSELFSTEVNLRRQAYPRLQWLVGFRYVEVNEDLRNIVLNNAGTPAFTIDNNTDNRLYGGQIGAEWEIWNCHRLTLDSVLKAGVYGNAAQHRGEFATLFNAFSQTASATAFLGEIGVTGHYQLNECWAVRGGYQMLWIDGVALASDQVAASNYVNETGIGTSGSVFYHGALVGLEKTW